MISVKPKSFLLNGAHKIESREIILKEEASDSVAEFNDVLMRNSDLTIESKSLTSSLLTIRLASLNAAALKNNGTIAPAQKRKHALPIERDNFKYENHFYPKVLNAKMHPVVRAFFKMGNERIVARYKQMNPNICIEKLKEILNYRPKYFKWAGSDLFNTTDENGKRRMIIIETNSCASGQKSMPLIAENQRFAGYKILLESIFEDLLGVDKISTEVDGDLAVVFDKNLTENSAYSAVLAELSKERVWLVEYVEGDELSGATVRWSDGVMYVRDIHNQWHPIRACLRYVTQKPWNKIPLNTKTRVVNPIAACLAGGRNKIMASYAYQKLNEELEKSNSGLSIRLPYSLINVNKSDIPNLFFNDKKLNGRAVVKVPYSNCGQGVYTLFNKYELDDFMKINHKYDKFIVQSLIGHNGWRKEDDDNSKSFYHIGTVPDAQNNIYVYDLRMIVTSNKDGFCPVSMNCRRARRPLNSDLSNVINQESDNDNNDKFGSWDMLGTNLSVKIDKNIWDTESDRLLIMDNNDFNVLGLGLDDLIDAYIQTVLSVISIDKMCIELLESNNQQFNYDLFKQLNPDDSLINEIRFN